MTRKILNRLSIISIQKCALLMWKTHVSKTRKDISDDIDSSFILTFVVKTLFWKQSMSLSSIVNIKRQRKELFCDAGR